MKLFYDLHIHTALSPCSDNDMTPNNIVNMALLKGLDVIAITDHNSSDNCGAVVSVAKDKDIIVIPGMELQTKEEVHLLCLFRSLVPCLEFNKHTKTLLPDTKNQPKIFGNQYILSDKDEVIGEESKALIVSLNISIKETVELVEYYKGVVIPAHIDRSSFSVISNLGFLPKELKTPTVELSKNCQLDDFLRLNPTIRNLNLLRNSDAHYLSDINERINYIEVTEKDIDSIINSLMTKFQGENK